MPSKLLKPRAMVVVEPCAICGREHTDERDYRRCAKCERVFCWLDEPKHPNIFGVERRSCGSCRDVSSDADLRRRIEFRCRDCVTRSWIMFGADWAAVRPLAVYVFLSVAFSLSFWGLLFWLVTTLLHRLGIG